MTIKKPKGLSANIRQVDQTRKVSSRQMSQNIRQYKAMKKGQKRL